MFGWADRMVKSVSDVTVGTVIVLVHVMLADRARRSLAGAAPRALAARDGGRPS